MSLVFVSFFFPGRRLLISATFCWRQTDSNTSNPLSHCALLSLSFFFLFGWEEVGKRGGRSESLTRSLSPSERKMLDGSETHHDTRSPAKEIKRNQEKRKKEIGKTYKETFFFPFSFIEKKRKRFSVGWVELGGSIVAS